MCSRLHRKDKAVSEQGEVKREIAVQSFVSVLRKKGRDIPKSIKDQSDILMVRQFVTEPAMVRRGYGLTMSLGNYESAKIDVNIVIPAYVEEIHEVDQYARDWCEERVVAEKNEIWGLIEERRKKTSRQNQGY